MRRTHASRIPPTRRQLAFEPLESRELLAADAGFDWSSYWDSPTADDWSWTFDDASGYDTAGAGAWGDDAWWAGDVAWDVPADGGAGYAADVGTDVDAGGSAWNADFGVTDATSTTDVVTPPASTSNAGPTNVPPATVVDVVSPSPTAPQPEPTVVVVSPDVETPASPPATDIAGQPDGVEPVADVETPAGAPTEPVDEVPVDDIEEPTVVLPPVIVVSADGGATTDDDVGFVRDFAASGDETAVDPTPADDAHEDLYEDADAGDPVPTEVVEVTIVDVPDDAGDVTWVYDTLDDTSPAEGMPSEPTADSGDDAVVDVIADVVADAVGEPTVVIVAPVGGGPVRSAGAPVVAIQPAASGIDGSRFAAWAAGFMQAFWRPAGDADGGLSGGLASGQTGTGRPRIRLPFRPIV